MEHPNGDTIDEEDDRDLISLLDANNTENIWTESDQTLCPFIKSEEILEEVDDYSIIMQQNNYKELPNNLPLSFFSYSTNLILSEKCGHFINPLMNCDECKKYSTNTGTSPFSDDSEVTLDIDGLEMVEDGVNDFESNYMTSKEENIVTTKNNKYNFETLGSKIILGNIKRDSNVLRDNGEWVFSRMDFDVNYKKNKGLVGLKIKKCGNKIPNEDIIKLEAETTNVAIHQGKLKINLNEKVESKNQHRKGNFDEMNRIGERVEALKNTIQRDQEKLKKSDTINKDIINPPSNICEKNANNILNLQSSNMDSISLKEKTMFVDNNILKNNTDNTHFNFNSNLKKMECNSKSCPDKIYVPSNTINQSACCTYKKVKTEKLHNRACHNGGVVLERIISRLNSDVNKDNNTYRFNTQHNVFMNTEPGVDVVNNNKSQDMHVLNNESTKNTFQKFETSVQKYSLTTQMIENYCGPQITEQKNIDTNIQDKQDKLKINIVACDHNVKESVIISKSAVESVAETQAIISGIGEGSNIRNTQSESNIRIKNVEVVAEIQNKKTRNRKFVSKISKKDRITPYAENLNQNQNFNNVSVNPDMTTNFPCRYNNCSCNTEYRLANIHKRNELIRIEKVNSVDDTNSYRMSNTLLQCNNNEQNKFDIMQIEQKQANNRNAVKNKIPQKENAMQSYMSNDLEMHNRSVNYYDNTSQFKQINNVNKSYNQSLAVNAVSNFRNSHQQYYRPLNDLTASGFNDNHCPVFIRPSLYYSPYMQNSERTVFRNPKIHAKISQYNNIVQQSYIPQYHHIPSYISYDLQPPIAHSYGCDMPLNFSTKLLPNIDFQNANCIDYSTPSHQVAPLLSAPVQCPVMKPTPSPVQESMSQVVTELAQVHSPVLVPIQATLTSLATATAQELVPAPEYSPVSTPESAQAPIPSPAQAVIPVPLIASETATALEISSVTKNSPVARLESVQTQEPLPVQAAISAPLAALETATAQELAPAPEPVRSPVLTVMPSPLVVLETATAQESARRPELSPVPSLITSSVLSSLQSALPKLQVLEENQSTLSPPAAIPTTESPNLHKIVRFTEPKMSKFNRSLYSFSKRQDLMNASKSKASTRDLYITRFAPQIDNKDVLTTINFATDNMKNDKEYILAELNFATNNMSDDKESISATTDNMSGKEKHTLENTKNNPLGQSARKLKKAGQQNAKIKNAYNSGSSKAVDYLPSVLPTSTSEKTLETALKTLYQKNEKREKTKALRENGPKVKLSAQLNVYNKQDNLKREYNIRKDNERNGEVKKNRISFEEYKKRRMLSQKH